MRSSRSPIGAQLAQCVGDGGVVGDAHAVGGQRADQRVGELAAVDEQGGRAVGGHQQMGEEDRIELHVAAAQIGQPGHVIQA